MSEVRDTLADWNPEAMLLGEEYDSALAGIVTVFNSTVACYDRAAVVGILARDMTNDEAEEYFEYNIRGAYVGPGTPAFLSFAGES